MKRKDIMNSLGKILWDVDNVRRKIDNLMAEIE